MTALAELTAKAERRTGSRSSAVTLVNQWLAQIQDSAGHLTKREAAEHILRELDRRRRDRCATR